MRWAACCLTVVLTGCMTPRDTSEADKKAIKDVESAWVKTASTKDVDAFVNYYADDGQVLMPNAPLFTGKPAIKEALKPMMADPNFSITFMSTRVEVSKSGDLGYTQGPYKMTFSDQRGTSSKTKENISPSSVSSPTEAGRQSKIRSCPTSRSLRPQTKNRPWGRPSANKR